MADSRADAVIAEEGGEWEQDKRNAGSQCITRELLSLFIFFHWGGECEAENKHKIDRGV
jgi:hypothetical protein